MNKILLVDDDRFILASIKTFLTRSGFTNIITASNGKEGYELFLSQEPDLIISDVNMPICGGFEFVKRVRETPGTETLPILLLSASISNKAQREGFKLGVENYICKPITREQRPVFIEIIKSALLRSQRQKEIINESLKDNVTGLLRRDSFYASLKKQFLTSSLDQSPFCIAILDIDHFKRVNDEHGHSSGDLVLKEFATIVNEALRENMDKVFRYGGEEFIVIINNANLAKANVALERVRAKVKDTKFIKDLKITFSTGVFEVNRGDFDSAEFYIVCADQALYEAKNNGRDCIVNYKSKEIKEAI